MTLSPEIVSSLAKAIAREVVRELRSAGIAPVAPAGDAITIGDLTIDERAYEARVNGDVVPLARREFALLLALARDAGRAFTLDQLLDLAWGEDSLEVEDGNMTVRVHVARVRRKLGGAARHIRTVPGVGYRLDK